MTAHEIYNLEFPALVEGLLLNGYRFKRVKNYPKALGQLQHVKKCIDEFEIVPNYGGHAITAEVSVPSPEPTAKLKWGKQGATHLDDILLLLSLFTGRHVWRKEGNEAIIVADHRVYTHGGLLRTGLPAIIDSDAIPQIDRGFEPGMNQVIKHLSEKKWIEKYRGGHYLFLANQTFRRGILETQFSLCYTIWEHLFSIHKDSWLKKGTIHRIPGKEKIAFILSEYGIKASECRKPKKFVDTRSRDREHSRIAYAKSTDDAECLTPETIYEIRNRVIHFGMFPDDKSTGVAVEFIYATELLVGKTLGLFQTYIPGCA